MNQTLYPDQSEVPMRIRSIFGNSGKICRTKRIQHGRHTKMKRPVSLLCTNICAGLLMLVCFAGNAAAEKETIRIAYAKWSCATAASNVVKAVLQEKLDYRCKLIPMGAEALWLSTASKDIDGFVCAWLPSLHQHLYAKAGYNVLDLGPNLKGTQVGLVVPDYVPIDSMAQLKDHAAQFSNRIIGIDDSAGIMRLTHKASTSYHMQDMELISGSGQSMTKTLGQKIKNREWVVVTGWTPHWKFARWDLKYLQDPKNVYGGSESIHTVVRKGLQKDAPRVFRFLDNFQWSPEDIHQVMDMIQRSGDPYSSAVTWMHQHPHQVQTWLAD